MKNLFKSSVILTVLAIAIAFNPMPVKADGHEFNLTVKHNINGRSLQMGLDKELPVDVYANNGYAFTFSFGETQELTLEEGTYLIEVKLAGTDDVVMSLGPVAIPGGVDVMIKAQLSANKTPTLKVKVK